MRRQDGVEHDRAKPALADFCQVLLCLNEFLYVMKFGAMAVLDIARAIVRGAP